MNITFEKDGTQKTMLDDKENIKCMELSGWKIVDKTPEKHDNAPQSNDELEGTPALPSGEPLAKRRGRPKGV